ncbi:uncharacterized protein LOC117301362 [Asterias rubens]|uniref:uncharacterized protein LOC117301362 n=1 Tax=Asterias rubens TaxID=7604 RepID=UPI001455CFC6|nr:uncharacterized protein LOC117301362 [Asterias rubens]
MEKNLNQPPILFTISEAGVDIDPDEIEAQQPRSHRSSPANGLPMEYRENALVTSAQRPTVTLREKNRCGGGGDRIPSVLTAVAVVVAFIALLIGSIGLARRGDIVVNISSGTGDTSEGEASNTSDTLDTERVWTFAIGDYGSRLEYIDSNSGEVKGYNVDVVNAVCRIADKNCKLIWDLYDRCWQSRAGSSPQAGIGLLGNWYDACTAWSATYERARTFAFTNELSKQHLAVFMVKMGTDANAFNWRDLTGKKIGFLQAYVEDENCLKRYPEITGATLPKEQIFYYETQQALLSAVNNDLVDAVFLNQFLEVTANLQLVSEKLDKCAISGMAIMTRKDNPLASWWNPAFKTLIASPEYRQICLGLEDVNVHGNIPGPLVEQQCVGF